MSGERRGFGGWLQDQGQNFDSMVQRQALARAQAARESAISGIKDSIMANPADPGYANAIQGAARNAAQAKAAMHPDAVSKHPEYADTVYPTAARDYREDVAQHWYQKPVESLNQAMADNAYARYGVIGSAAVGGGAAMTAGAQKLLGLMGALQQANESEEARQLPLQ